MSIDAPSPRGRRGPYAKSGPRRAAIVEAAHRVFAAQGYRGGSIQDVADEVGMSQTSLLYYFPSKSDLLVAVLARRDAIIDHDRFPAGDTTRLAERVGRQVAFNETVPGVLELYTVLCGEAVASDHPAHTYFVARFDRLREEYTREFRALAQAGRLRAGVDPARAAASLIALWDGAQTQWLMAPDGVDVAACLQDYLDLVILPH